MRQPKQQPPRARQYRKPILRKRRRLAEVTEGAAGNIIVVSGQAFL